MQFISEQEVGKRYGVTPHTVRRWSRFNPGFPQPVSLSPGCTRWRVTDLEAFEAALATAQADPATAPVKRPRGRPRKVAA